MNNKSQPPLLSIIISSWNSWDLLKRVLSSIQKHVKIFPLEVIVCDDASKKDYSGLMRKNFPAYKFIRSAKNLGFSGNNNQGIKISKGKYVAILGNDVYFTKNIFLEIIKFFKKNNKIGALTPKLLYPDGKYQYICRSFPTLKNLFWQTFVDLKLLPDNQKWGKYKMQWIKKNQIQEVDQIDASCSIYNGDLLRKIGGFDEKLKNYMNDVDLCYRIKKAGHKIIYYPKVFAYHEHGQSFGKMEIKKRLKNWDTIKQFYLKHYVKSKLSLQYISLSALLCFRKVIVKLTGLHSNKY